MMNVYEYFQEMYAASTSDEEKDAVKEMEIQLYNELHEGEENLEQWEKETEASLDIICRTVGMFTKIVCTRLMG